MQTKILQNLFLILLIFIGINTAALTSAGTALAGEKTTLFESIEARQESSEISEQLEVVMSRYEQESVKGFSDKGSQKWQSFLATLEGMSEVEQIKAVNTYVNRKSYKTDKANYGTGDYWATPKEFFDRGGDCEDFAIVKLLSLQQLGFNTDSLRVVVLIDTELRTPHAVLAAYIDGDVLILDNQSSTVKSHTTLSNYVPLYSINSTGWWMHSFS
ncbi:hypothetical protein MNBD_DELTA01-223 [hydrothermal vent metagenome]|uniref:FIGfam010717 n=1 Tax=hydrothermal vent metagenome TaxID=652676 RepID=A0A3B0R7W9_9ZZZZ